MVRLLVLATGLAACRPACEPTPEIPADGVDQDCDGGDPSGRFRVLRTLEGAPDAGFGYSLAYGPSGLLVGAPLGPRPSVSREGVSVVEGPADSFTGSVIRSGLVSSPRTGHGQVLDLDGAVVWQGTTEQGTGSYPTPFRDGLAAVDGSKVVSTAGETWEVGSRVVSLVNWHTEEGEVLVAGTLDAGLWIDGTLIPAGREVGRSMATCDLDGDGDEDLVLGVPSRNQVWLFTADRASELDLARPAVALDTREGRGGQAVACRGGRVVVGAPMADDGAGWVGLWEAPLLLGIPVAEHSGSRREQLGFSVLHDGASEVVAGAPGEGRVYVLSAR